MTGRRIVSHYATGTEGVRYASGSVLLIDDRGLPRGGVNVTNVSNQQMKPNSVGGATVMLNWQAQVVLIA